MAGLPGLQLALQAWVPRDGDQLAPSSLGCEGARSWDS